MWESVVYGCGLLVDGLLVVGLLVVGLLVVGLLVVGRAKDINELLHAVAILLGRMDSIKLSKSLTFYR